MVVERSWILGVLLCGLAAPTACGGISVSHSDNGEAGDGAQGGNGANGGKGGTGQGAGPGAGGGGTGGGGGGVGGVSPSGGTTPMGGSTQAGGTGGVSTGGKGGFTTGGTFTGGTGMGALGGALPMGGTGGAPPMGGTAGTVALPDFGIPWDASGIIDSNYNVFGIYGSWYFVTDCIATAGTGLECTKSDPSLVGPDMKFGWSTSPERVCMRGIAPQVANNPVTGMPAYDLQWGAMLGFQLAGGAAYDAGTHAIYGFRFDITANFEATVRVNIESVSTVGVPHFVEIFLPSPNQVVLFEDALQGSWVTMPTPLDTSALTSVAFHVYTSAAASRPFDVCISNLRGIF